MRQTLTTQKTDTGNKVYDETDTHYSKDWHSLQGLWWHRHSLLKRLTQITWFMMRQTFTTQKTDTDNMVYDETDTHHSKDWHTLQGLWWDRHSLLKRLTQLTRFMMRQTLTTQKTDTAYKVYDETDTHYSKDWHSLQGLWWHRHSLLKRLTQITWFMMRQTFTTQKTDTDNMVYDETDIHHSKDWHR